MDLTRRLAIQLAAAHPLAGAVAWTIDAGATPAYERTKAAINFHTTAGYSERWKNVYQRSLLHFADRYGRVGPTHIFLVENADWRDSTPMSREVELRASQRALKKQFRRLQGRDDDGADLDWPTGQHWMGWSIKPPNLMITMTMSPLRDGLQFVIGPIHEYLHAYQAAFGFAEEAIDGNRNGHSRWTGPAWWREGSSVLVAALYAHRHPQLFRNTGQSYGWKQLSHDLNRNLRTYRQAKGDIREGVSHDDWQRLEKKKRVYPIIYAGGSSACALLLRHAGSLDRFMRFFQRVPRQGWEKAFQAHFDVSLTEFYAHFAEESRTTPKDQDWFAFLRDLP